MVWLFYWMRPLYYLYCHFEQVVHILDICMGTGSMPWNCNIAAWIIDYKEPKDTVFTGMHYATAACQCAKTNNVCSHDLTKCFHLPIRSHVTGCVKKTHSTIYHNSYTAHGHEEALKIGAASVLVSHIRSATDQWRLAEEMVCVCGSVEAWCVLFVACLK